MHIMHIPHPNIALQCILCTYFIQIYDACAFNEAKTEKRNLLIVSPIGDEDPGLMKNDLNKDFSKFSFYVLVSKL